MIAWTVLFGLGNGTVISMGPVLYSDVIYQGPELGDNLPAKSRAPLRCGSTKGSSMGTLEYLSPDGGILLPARV